MANKARKRGAAPKTGLDSRQWMDAVKRTNEAADRALEQYGEPVMSLEELRHALDECLGSVTLSEEILRQRQAGW